MNSGSSVSARTTCSRRSYYLATLRLLRDLILQGWMPASDDDGIYILPPHGHGRRRGPLRSEVRPSQLVSSSPSRISSSRRRSRRSSPRWSSNGVAALFADGPELAKRIEKARNEAATLESAIRPVLELVIARGSRIRGTGLRLQDVWRYARLQWSIPYQTTPGRNMHYLIRDEAGPNRPIIGIAALGNAILGLAQRDDALGWSVQSLARRLDEASAAEQRKVVRHLLEFIRAEAERIYADDFAL